MYPSGTFAIVGMDTARFNAFTVACGRLRLPENWEFHGVFNYSCAHACNHIVEEMLDDREWLILMGDDHVFTSDLAQRLLDSALENNLDIVAPLVLGRHVPFEPCMRLNGKPLEPNGHPGLVEVEVTGTAGMLIHRRVFEKVKFPYFLSTYEGDGEPISDDQYFCRKARRAGFKIHVDTRIGISHLSVLGIEPIYDGEWKTRTMVANRELVMIKREG